MLTKSEFKFPVILDNTIVSTWETCPTKATLGHFLHLKPRGPQVHLDAGKVFAKALEDYLARVVRSGRRAAICEQVENPAEAKGIVRRAVVETVTPGTVLHDNLLTFERTLWSSTPDTRLSKGVAILPPHTSLLLAPAI
jgi:hypothetical protein